MTQLIRYLTHPQVTIDPDVPVPQWSLNDIGAGRVQALVARGALAGTTRIVSSDETKALETAQPLADSLGIALVVRPDMHENDRSATGFLPGEVFEAMADAFFAKPDVSTRGWETSRTAQTRVVAAFYACLKEPTKGDTLFVGHGAVGTLLYCALANLPIDRKYDQGRGGGGNFITCPAETLIPQHHWRPMEDLS